MNNQSISRPEGREISGSPYSESSLRSLWLREIDLYCKRRPLSKVRQRASQSGFVSGVPLHWMRDWPQPFPMVIDLAHANRLRDIDGNEVVDFCLGDTGAMFGHSPQAVIQALRERESKGLTYMLPSQDVDRVGTLLSERFGLPFWQMAVSASDANRFALRAARAVTGRKRCLVFDGCYHGTVEETLVDLIDGKTVSRRSLIGQAQDLSLTTVAVPFNDEDAVLKALSGGDIACVIAEPVMTNCGMILPRPGFLEWLRTATSQAGALLLLDETHTISTGPGGYAKAHGLAADLLVVGKPIAGGIPTGVWGMTREIAERLLAARSEGEQGHSGMGTTLSGSALQIAGVLATLEKLMTPEIYAIMIAGAEAIEAGIRSLIELHGLPWHVARVGARLEIVFSRAPLANAVEMRATTQSELQRLLHVSLLNRGFLLTPFHNMMLVGPDTTEADVEAFLQAFGEILDLLIAEGRE